METSILTSGIQNSQAVRDRIAAIVQQAWWNDDIDHNASAVPVETLAWACACDADVQAAVAAAEGTDDRNIVERGVRLIPDELLREVVLVKALPRLVPMVTGNPA